MFIQNVLAEIVAIQTPVWQAFHRGIMVSIAAFGPGYPGSNPGKSN